jgi:hypothetical protein
MIPGKLPLAGVVVKPICTSLVALCGPSGRVGDFEHVLFGQRLKEIFYKK